jgi:hypothetical protein
MSRSAYNSGMKVFNLCCDREHRFEGWFASAQEYESQLARGLVACPVCESTEIRKLLSAPRINKGARAPVVVPRAEPQASDVALHEKHGEHAELIQKMWFEAARKIIRDTDDVGDAFAQEARKIHYAEVPARGIRGVATPREASELAEEGIDIFAFPLPAALKEPLQ